VAGDRGGGFHRSPSCRLAAPGAFMMIARLVQWGIGASHHLRLQLAGGWDCC
jgi:hypothetical protein